MPNVINYIEKLLAKANKGKNAPGWWEIIYGGDGNRNRVYNKENLWIAFNKYDQDALASDEATGEYLLKNHHLETKELQG